MELEFRALDDCERAKMVYISILEPEVEKRFREKLKSFHLIHGGEILSAIEHFGSVAYNIMLAVLDNEQLTSLFFIPNQQYRWIFLNKEGQIIRKSKRTFDSVNECERKANWILSFYPDLQFLVE